MDFKFEWTTQNTIIIVILIVILAIILQIITTKFKYKSMFDWWNSNGGNLYDKKFNLFAVMSSYESYIMYLGSLLFGTLTNQISRGEIIFLVEKIFPLTYISGMSEITQFVLPRNITESIQFERGDNDIWFNKWLDDNVYNDQVYLRYNVVGEDPKPNENGEIIYNIQQRIPDPNKNTIGVYPSVTDRVAWKYLFVEWGAKTWVTEKNSSFLQCSMTPDDQTEWFSYEKHPDNFLARYGIMPNCPIIFAYINNAFNDPDTGLKIDANAFEHLINGGWIGYLNGIQNSSFSEDDYVNLLYTNYAINITIPKPKVSPSNDCDTGTNVISSISTGLGPLGVGALFGAPGIVAGLIAGIGLSIAQGVTTANKCADK